MRSIHLTQGEKVQIKIEGLKKAFTMMQITDAHVSLIDERDPDHFKRLRAENHMEQFPNNMLDAKGNKINPTDRFARLIEKVEVIRPDVLCLTGDIIHYPSELAIEFVKNRLEKTGIPIIYTPGNHDWCFTNVPGSHQERQSGWQKINNLHKDPFEYAQYNIQGIQFILLDNSIYQITPDQLRFVQESLKTEQPTIIMMHIPLSLPTLRSPVIQIYDAPLLMADPDWPPDSRWKWGASPDLPETLCFRDLLACAKNLIAVFSGHIHINHTDNISPWTVQYVTGPAFKEIYRLVEFIPLKSK